jgi:hypothetical protein
VSVIMEGNKLFLMEMFSLFINLLVPRSFP